MSVMDMLAANEAAEAAKTDHAAGKAKGRLQGAGRPSGGGGGGSNNCTAPASAASSADASGDEAGLDGDDAMDEDVSGDGDDSEEDGSDSDEDGEGEEERHARLLGFVGTLGEQAAAARQAADDRCSSQLLREGEFNPTAVAAVSSGGGSASKSAITMEVRRSRGKGCGRGDALCGAWHGFCLLCCSLFCLVPDMGTAATGREQVLQASVVYRALAPHVRSREFRAGCAEAWPREAPPHYPALMSRVSRRVNFPPLECL